MKNKPIYLFLLAFTAILATSCEKEITPAANDIEPQLVVEGYIEAAEAGAFVLPAYVILTKTTSYFAPLNANTFGNLFVRGAKVTVSEGGRTVQLAEKCLDKLTAAEQALVSQLLGGGGVALNPQTCIYIDTTFTMVGQVSKTYTLNIQVEGKTVTSQTTIPPLNGLDSVFVRPVPDVTNDTLVQVRASLTDPIDIKNFYAYYTQRQGQGSYQSQVFDDVIVNGTSLEFPINRRDPPNSPGGSDATFGYFWRGDTVNVTWKNYDKPQYDFWNTLRFNSQQQGPFSSFTRVKSNIVGGLGLWGGAAVSRYRVIVPKK